jgi:glyoxylase-like metal-dependent hydrolase (beta-lactamase superfamily II)
MNFWAVLRKRRPNRSRARPALALAPLVIALVAPGGPGGSDGPKSPGPAAKPTYAVTRLSSRVIVLDCLNVNVTAIASDSGIVVIDTNRSPAAMRTLRGVIETEFRRKDFTYLINTHGDPDHSSGNSVFPGVPLIAQENYAAYVAHSKASTLRNEWARKSRPEAGSALRTTEAARIPAVTFRDSLRLDLGDLTLELYFCGAAHTNHDIVVYVPEEKLLLAGDLICSRESPCFAVNAMADVPRLTRELEGLLRRQEGLLTIVPGHGKILTRDDLSSFCRALSERYREVKADRSAARLLSQAIDREGIRAALDRYPPPVPGHPGTLDWSEDEFGTLGVRLMRRGMVDEALRVLELAVRVFPQSSILYAYLGDACVENGDRKSAVAAYKKSLALAPDFKRVAEMLKALGGGR